MHQSVECNTRIDPACSCSVWGFFSSILGKGRNKQRLLQTVLWVIQCAHSAIQIKSLQQLKVPLPVAKCRSREAFCFDWRIHSHCQDFRISFLIWSGSWYLTATGIEESWAGVVSPQTKPCCWLVGIKARRVAHLKAKWTIYTVSGQYVQIFFVCALYAPKK